jgi:GTP-binding protein Era
MIFLDTPGLLSADDLLQRSMLGAALEALSEADVVVVLIDASRPFKPNHRALIANSLSEVRAPILCAINKIDTASEAAILDVTTWAEDALGVRTFPISATSTEGLQELRDAIEDELPEGPFLYPADDVASQPVRFFVGELIRETIFEQFRQEVPYAAFAVVEEFREEQDPVYIAATVFVERNSQKRIVVGDKGDAVKRLGQVSRRKIEDFLGRPVYLDLWVKHLHDWRRKRSHLKKLGFRIPEEHEVSTRS